MNGMKHYILTSGAYSDYRLGGLVAHAEPQDMKALLEEYITTACPVESWNEDCYDFEESAFILWLTLNKGFTEIDTDEFHTHGYSISKDEYGNIEY